MDFYLYMYKCKLIRIIDGDTLECNVDLGFNILRKSILRLQDIDAPELKTKDLVEKAHAMESTEALKNMILDENPEGVFYIHSKKIDSFGRCLATVILKSGLEVNTELVDLGYASKWKI